MGGSSAIARSGVGDFFDLRAAAAHVGFTVPAFLKWQRCGFLPAADPNTGGWIKEELDRALAEIQTNGVQHDNPRWRHSNFRKIANAHRVWRKLEKDRVGHWLFYFRPTLERLPSVWGSAEFMRALIECERRWASEQLTAKPSDLSLTQSTIASEPAGPPTVPNKTVPAPNRKRPPALRANTSTKQPSIIPDLPCGKPNKAKPTPSDRLTETLGVSPLFLTPAELVRRWRGQISEPTLANWRAARTGVPFVRVGRQPLYRLVDVERFERERLVPCDPAVPNTGDPT
jgi:hypothetical protein